jgi:molecular chaperone GrpE
LKTELEAKKKELAVLKVCPSIALSLTSPDTIFAHQVITQDQYLRQIADYQNLQTRTKREAQASKDFALQSFFKDLIPSLDNLGHALAAVPAEKLAPPKEDTDVTTIHKDLVNLHEGLTMIETVLMGTLTKHGVTKVDPAANNDAFDPNKHEAVFQAPMPGKEDGIVFHTQQQGYLLNGRVLRVC